jgi:uncharacterized protein (DUF2236 family)
VAASSGRKQPRLGKADRERLEYATGRSDLDYGRSLFDPSGQVQRVNREGILLLGGGRALLLQVAHPLVAAGVAEHSNFENEPLKRLWRTLDLTLTVAFGDAVSALRAVRQIEARHVPVRGTLASRVGRFPAGADYDAADPELLFWVHATLVDSARRVYERCIEPLSHVERSGFYEESKITARLFGIPQSTIPESFAEFSDYMKEMVNGPDLAVGEDARRIAASILRPPLGPGLRQLAAPSSFFTNGFTPAPVRELYGLSWTKGRERRLNRLCALSRFGVPLLPGLVREFPHARRARNSPPSQGVSIF